MTTVEAKGVDLSTRRTGGKPFELIRTCGLGPDDPIILVGEVDAQLIAALLRLGHRDVTVIGPSAEALGSLRKALRGLEGHVILLDQNVLVFRPRRRYALWHDCGLFHRLRHPDERWQYVEVVQQALRPEGHLMITSPGPRDADSRTQAPVARYTPQSLAAELGRQFELTEHGLALHPGAAGDDAEQLHYHFRRHAPRWP